MNFELLDQDRHGNQLIKLTSGDFSGIIYHYGRVVFVEENDQLRIQFEHCVIHNPHQWLNFETNQEFKQHLGDILVELIDTGLMKHEVTYTGGTDENRTTNSE